LLDAIFFAMGFMGFFTEKETRIALVLNSRNGLEATGAMEKEEYDMIPASSPK